MLHWGPLLSFFKKNWFLLINQKLSRRLQFCHTNLDSKIGLYAPIVKEVRCCKNRHFTWFKNEVTLSNVICNVISLLNYKLNISGSTKHPKFLVSILGVTDRQPACKKKTNQRVGRDHLHLPQCLLSAT